MDACEWPSLRIAQPLNNLHGRGSKLWLTAGALQEQPRCNGRAHGRELQRAGAPIRGAIELQQQAGSTSAGDTTSRLTSRNTVDCGMLYRSLKAPLIRQHMSKADSQQPQRAKAPVERSC